MQLFFRLTGILEFSWVSLRGDGLKDNFAVFFSQKHVYVILFDVFTSCLLQDGGGDDLRFIGGFGFHLDYLAFPVGGVFVHLGLLSLTTLVYHTRVR